MAKQVFMETPHSFAVVNLKPIVPGHVLVCPLTPHLRLTDLSPTETADLFSSVQRVQRMLGLVHFGTETPGDNKSGSFTVAVQDGPEAGQTVPHVHVHVIPRARDDMGAGESPDEVYVKMAGEEGNVGGALWDERAMATAKRPQPGGGMPRVEDADRRARSPEEMHAEADMYRAAMGKIKTRD